MTAGENSPIRILFEKYYNRTASEAEEQALMKLIMDDPKSRELISALEEQWNELKASDLQFSAETGHPLLQKILGEIETPSGVPENDLVSLSPKRPKLIMLRRASVAAAAIIVLGVGAYLWNAQENKSTSTAGASAKAVKADIAPGGQRAVLTLSDGSTIILDSATNGTLALQGNSEIIKKDGQIIYGNKEGNPSYPPLAGVSRSDGGGQAAIPYNTMATPRGGQYQLTLPDGTKVWLNAASSITYPAVFVGNERKVKVTGEAYLEVAKDKTKPFFVDIDGQSTVQVLGTSFNINSYADDETIKTTLIEGSVKISGTAKNSIILKPGQQAQVEKSGTIHLKERADLEGVMAWKNGRFSFENSSVKNIMRQVSRWYDVDIVYEGPVPDEQFMGGTSRQDNISALLAVLEATNKIHFKIEGKKVIVTK